MGKFVDRRFVISKIFTRFGERSSPKACYDLDPIRMDHEQALVTSDVEGIEQVTLQEISFDWGGPDGDMEVWRSRNIFRSLRARKGELRDARISEARFSMKFQDDPDPRTVTVRPPDLAAFDAIEKRKLIEEWFELRGFVKTEVGRE